MQTPLQDLFQDLLEELSGGGLARWLHLWEYNDSSAGDQLVQRQGQRRFPHPDTFQLRMAGKIAHRRAHLSSFIPVSVIMTPQYFRERTRTGQRV